MLQRTCFRNNKLRQAFKFPVISSLSHLVKRTCSNDKNSLLSEREHSLAMLMDKNGSAFQYAIRSRIQQMERKLNILREKGYMITEREDIVIVNRERDNRIVTVSWDPTKPYPHPQNAKPKKLKEQFETEDIPVTVSIKKASKSLFLDCIVGDTHQIQINKILPGRRTQYAAPVRLSSVPEKVLLRLYDYMETLGTGDGMAGFIAEYNSIQQLRKVSRALELMQKEFLSQN